MHTPTVWAVGGERKGGKGVGVGKEDRQFEGAAVMGDRRGMMRRWAANTKRTCIKTLTHFSFSVSKEGACALLEDLSGARHGCRVGEGLEV